MNMSLIEVSLIGFSGVLNKIDSVLMVKPLLSHSKQMKSISSGDHLLADFQESVCVAVGSLDECFLPL